MKKLTKKQWITIAIAATLVVAAGVAIWMIVGNNGDGNDSAKEQLDPPKTTEELMERAATEFSAVKSFQLDTNMTLTMKSGDEVIDMSALVTNFFIKGADVQKAISTMTAGTMGSYSTTTYTEKDGESYNVYNSVDGGIEWTKETVDSEELLPTGDPSEEILRFLTGVTNYEKGESQEIGGVKTTCYECVLNAEEMKQTLKEVGLFEQLGSDEFSDEELNSIYEELESIKFSVWIGDEDYLPYKLYMDMGNMISAMAQFADIDDSQKEMMEMLDGVTMSYTISNYNLLEEIDLPKEAKNASEAE